MDTESKKFKVGDKVEFHKGGFGKVTQASEWSCTVLWNDHKHGITKNKN